MGGGRGKRGEEHGRRRRGGEADKGTHAGRIAGGKGGGGGGEEG